MDDEVTISIQKYQSIVLLDLLIEFREEFIRRILSRWLRANCMPSSYARKRYEKNICDYFNIEDPNFCQRLKSDFAKWRESMGGAADAPDETFNTFVDELEASLKAIEEEFGRFLVLMPREGKLSTEDDCDFTKGNIDRLRETKFTSNEAEKSEARRVGLAIDAFIRTPEFVKHLHPSTSKEGKQGTYGLLAMFNIVLLAVDYTQAKKIKSEDRVKRYSGGRFRFVLPPDELLFKSAEDDGHLEDGRYSFQTFFPLISEKKDAQRLEQAIKDSVRVCGCEMEQRDEFDPANLLPAIFRGANTFVYDTKYAKPLFTKLARQNGHVPHECWTVHRNVNFIQLLPSPELKTYGYFQLQSPLPGLVRALFPIDECGDSWNRLYLESENLVSSVSSNGSKQRQSVALVEMPRLEEKWFGHLKEAHSQNDFVLEGIHWIRNSITPWSKRFHNQMVYLDELKESLWKSIEPKINERHRQQLELLRKPLENLTEALGGMQRDTQELRAVLYDPSKALFHSAPLLAHLFEQDAVIDVSPHLRVMVSHQIDGYWVESHDDDQSPRKRRETKVNGRVILVLALCRIYGCTEVLLSAKKSQEAIMLAAQELGDRVTKTAFAELTRDLQWLLGERFWEKLESDAPSGALKNLKKALFDPFKLSARSWNSKVFDLAALHYAETLPDSGKVETEYTMPSEWTPVAVHTALAFIVDICAEAHSRREDKRHVQSIEFENDGVMETEDSPSKPPTYFRIKCVFSGKYLKNRTDEERRGWEQLKTLIGQHVLQKETRDWRISESRAGNFIKPYLDLASRILGFGTDWMEIDSSAEEAVLFRIGNRSSSRSFSVSLNPPAASEAKEVCLSWEPITPQPSE